MISKPNRLDSFGQLAVSCKATDKGKADKSRHPRRCEIRIVPFNHNAIFPFRPFCRPAPSSTVITMMCRQEPSTLIALTSSPFSKPKSIRLGNLHMPYTSSFNFLNLSSLLSDCVASATNFRKTLPMDLHHQLALPCNIDDVRS